MTAWNAFAGRDIMATIAEYSKTSKLRYDHRRTDKDVDNKTAKCTRRDRRCGYVSAKGRSGMTRDECVRQANDKKRILN